MKINVKFCPCNFEDELESTKEKLRGRMDLKIFEERCLLYCGQCLIQPFVLVNGENIVAEEPCKLYEKVDQYVTRIKQGSIEATSKKRPKDIGVRKKDKLCTSGELDKCLYLRI